MKVFLLFYFIHWFYVFGVGVGGLGQGPSALAQISPLTGQMYKCYTCSVILEVTKVAHGTTYLFLFDSCWDSKGSTSERSWPLLGNDSIQLHHTHSTALSCWALRLFKEHCHELR